MAKTTPVKKAWRSLTWLLVIIIALVALNGAGVLWGNASWAPKLALDLEGGTQIILEPKLTTGQTVTSDQLTQAVSIMRQRINASGVTEAEVTTQGAGGNENVVVSIPGTPDKATLERIRASAKLDFRPVLMTAAAPSSTAGSTATPTPTGTAGSTAVATPTPTPTAPLSDVPTSKPTNDSDLAWITPALAAQYANFNCKSDAAAATNVAPADKPLVTCDTAGTTKFILGPVEVPGTTISDANNSIVTNSSGVSTGQWGVNIIFNATGTKEFAAVTTRLFGMTGVQNQFAIVLDGLVISAPTTNAVITDGKPQITGSFTQVTSQTLADQLKFGALPIAFQVQSQEVISATLGSSQLLTGLLAGMIGLILVVLYSLLQYRMLGFVTIASLVVSATFTYLIINLLSANEGYRLSLAGVAGVIVSIGITADSFIVYFERIRDELRTGRGLESAVEAGWKRALRTILASDAVNLLAASVLFVLAIGDVRGFALTLGLTTIIDVFVVCLFTHPTLRLLARTKFFGEGHRFSGLDPTALGAVYRGRAKFREPVAVGGKLVGSGREAVRRQTIAERKAAEAESRRTTGKDS